MEFKKKDILRALEELIEYATNVLDSSFMDYTKRLQQFFNLIEQNQILEFIITPYLKMTLDEKTTGLVDGYHGRLDYIIPIEEDKEIAILLQILKECTKNNQAIINMTMKLYVKKLYQDNLNIFNERIVRPAINKLIRKIRYKFEDLQVIQNESIESTKISIINIGNIEASNSIIAIGENIQQINKDNIFSQMIEKIKTEIKNEEIKTELITAIQRMEKYKDSKISFTEAYNDFLIKIGTYMTILGPFLPYLVTYLNR